MRISSQSIGSFLAWPTALVVATSSFGIEERRLPNVAAEPGWFSPTPTHRRCRTPGLDWPMDRSMRSRAIQMPNLWAALYAIHIAHERDDRGSIDGYNCSKPEHARYRTAKNHIYKLNNWVLIESLSRFGSGRFFERRRAENRARHTNQKQLAFNKL